MVLNHLRPSDGKFPSSHILTIGMEPYSKYDTIDGYNICYSLWDIAGHDRFKQMRSMFYRGTMASILFFDFRYRMTLDYVPTIINEVKKEAPDHVVILVGLGGDDGIHREVSTEEAVVTAKQLECLKYVEFKKKFDPKKMNEILSTLGIFLLNIRKRKIGPEIYDTIDFLYFAINKPEWIYLDKTVFKLRKNKLLEKIIVEIDDLWVKYTAAEKLIDPKIQQKLLSNKYDETVHNAVNWGINHPRSKHGLPVHISPTIAKIIVQNITNQEMLENMFFEIKNDNVKIEVIAKISNQNMIEQVALENNVDEIRLAATKRLAIQKSLEKIALTDKSAVIRQQAIKMVVDQNVIEKVVLKDMQKFVRREAVQKLKNQDILKGLAIYDSDAEIRQNAVFKVNDIHIIEKVALFDRNNLVRYEATRKLTNQEIIKKIALHDDDEKVKIEAIEKLNDQLTLMKIVLCNNSYKVVFSAFIKLKQPELIEKVALETNYPEICMLSIVKIINIKTLLMLRLIKEPTIQPYITDRIKELTDN